MKKKLDLAPEHYHIILSILSRFIPGITVWAHGSRVKGNARKNSDLDLIVFANHQKKIEISNLKEAFEESDLPFRVDLLVWDEIPKDFQKNITAEYIILQ